MSTFETILAATIILAAIAQIVILILLYRVVSRSYDRISGVVEEVGSQLQDAASSIRAVRSSIDSSSAEIRATLAGVRATTASLGELAEREGREIARVIGKATAMAERQVEETQRSLDQVRLRVADVGETFDRTVLEPVRIILAMVAGIHRGVNRLIRPDSRSDVPYERPRDVGSA